MMLEGRTKILILLCGIFVSIATPLCHAQEPGKLFDVKMPQAEASQILVPEITNSSAPIPAQVKPDKKASVHPWYVLILEWLAMDIARYNTDKQGDGRPNLHGGFR